MVQAVLIRPVVQGSATSVRVLGWREVVGNGGNEVHLREEQFRTVTALKTCIYIHPGKKNGMRIT